MSGEKAGGIREIALTNPRAGDKMNMRAVPSVTGARPGHENVKIQCVKEGNLK